MKTVKIISLGCSKNLVDSELIAGQLIKNNYILVKQQKEADVIIVNTCGFIEAAKQEAIDTILEVAEYKKTGKCKMLIIAGCLAQRYSEDLYEKISEIDVIVGTGKWREIVKVIDKKFLKERIICIGEPVSLQKNGDTRTIFTAKKSVYIKIADGCSNRCSYCAIPLIKGNMKSRDIASISIEANRLVSSGVKELILIAQDTTSYGYDLYNKPQLINLLREITAIKGDFWIRLLYCYPKYFNEELIELIANEPKVCKYIDIPLQHIDDDILKKMNRKDTHEEIKILLNKIKNRIPDIALRTTFIVGFPGETEEKFKKLTNFIQENQFDHVGAFKFSAEEGTLAAEFKDTVNNIIKEERYNKLMSIQSKISQIQNKKRIGKVTKVLIEGKRRGQFYGRSQYEAIEVDGKIFLDSKNKNIKIGDKIKVQIIDGFAYDKIGKIIK